LSTPIASTHPQNSPCHLNFINTPPETANRKIDAAARTRRPPEQEAAIGDAAASICFTVVDNVAVHLALDRRSSDELADPLPPSR
jgi:hypothetical protein